MILKTIQKRNYNLEKYRKLASKNKDILTLKEKILQNSNSCSEPNFLNKTMLKKFKIKQEKLEESRERISQENIQFLNSYHLIEKIYPKKIKESFKTLIENYKERGYKTPNFSSAKNIFKPNPLLINNDKLIDYFNEKQRNKRAIPKFIYKNFIHKKENKHLIFLKKEESIVNEELKKCKKEKEKIIGIKNNEKQKIPLKSYSGKNMIEIIKESAFNINSQEENEEIKKYNKTIEKIIPLIKIKHSSIRHNMVNISNSNSLNNSKLKLRKHFKSVILDETNFATVSNQKNNGNNIKNIFKNRKNLNDHNNLFLAYKINKIKNLKKNCVLNKLKNALNKLLNEENQKNFLDDCENIDLTQLNRKDLEFIAKTYCKKFLKYSDIDIENLLKPKYSDKDIIDLIRNFLFKIEYSNIFDNNLYFNYQTREKVNEKNIESQKLQKKYELYIVNKSLNK